LVHKAILSFATLWLHIDHMLFDFGCHGVS
jgi:hypothetical protein